jgi:hypothetical protein
MLPNVARSAHDETVIQGLDHQDATHGVRIMPAFPK